MILTSPLVLVAVNLNVNWNTISSSTNPVAGSRQRTVVADRDVRDRVTRCELLELELLDGEKENNIYIDFL